jgi:hypothetical protein
MAAPVIYSATIVPVGASSSSTLGWIKASKKFVAGQFRLAASPSLPGPVDPTWAAEDAPLALAGGEITWGNFSVGDTTHTDFAVSRTGGPLEVGDWAFEVRVKDDAGVWSDPYRVEFGVFLDAQTVSGLQIERSNSSGVFEAGEPLGMSTTVPSQVGEMSVNCSYFLKSSGVYVAQVRLGGSSGAVYESPSKATSGGSIAARVRVDVAGNVLSVQWTDGTGLRKAADGRVLARGSSTTEYRNPDGSVAFTGGDLALQNADGTWAWTQSFTGGGIDNLRQAAIGAGVAVYAFGMTPAAGQTYVSADGSWTYTKDFEGRGGMFLGLSLADGTVIWSQVARTSHTGLRSRGVNVSMSPSGKLFAHYDQGFVGGEQRNITLDGTSYATEDLFMRLDPADGSVIWVNTGTNIQTATTALEAQEDEFYVGFSVGDASISWSGTSLSGLNRDTLVARLSPIDGSVSWFTKVPSTGGTNASSAGRGLAASSSEGVWTRDTKAPQRFTFYNKDGNIGPALLANIPYGNSRPPVAWPTSERDLAVVANSPADSSTTDPARDGDLVNADGTIAGNIFRKSFYIPLSGGDGTWLLVPGGQANALMPPVADSGAITQLEDTIRIETFSGIDSRDPAPTSPDYVLEALDPATGQWLTPTVENPLVLQGGFNQTGTPGTGEVVLSQPVNPDWLFAGLTFTPGPDWYGNFRIFLRWKDRSTGAVSAATRYQVIYVNDPDQPGPPEGQMPTVPEDTVSDGIFTTVDPDRSGTYTWQLSPQTTKPDGWDDETQGDWRTTTGSSVTVLVDGQPVGTASMLSQNDNPSNPSAVIRFTPAANWNGTGRFSLRVYNGELWSAWIVATVTVTPVDDAPSAVIGDAPDFDEDDTAEFTLTWTDPDNLDGTDTAEGSGYRLELGLTASGPWTQTGVLAVNGATIRVLSYSDTALAATLRAEGAADYNGPYAFGVRVVDPTGLRGPARLLTGTINPVPDAPARVTPGRMPAAKHGQTVTGRFFTSDPDLDDETWTFTIAARPEGPWGSSLTVPSVGTLTVIDADLSDFQADVRLVQQDGGSDLARYRFFIRATDDAGLHSPITEVVGFIAPPQVSGWLQRLDRTSSGVTITRLCPLVSLTRLQITEALTGAGSAEVTVSAREIRQRAADLSVTPGALLEVGAVEIAVVAGGQTVWVGPLTEVRWDAGGDTVDISARGLLSYFDARVLDADTTFTNEDLSAIVGDLIEDSQDADYGALAIVDGTAPAGKNLTITFPVGERITAVLRDLAEEPDAPEVWIDPDRFLRTATVRGADRRSKVRLTSGMCEVARWETRAADLATVVTVVAPDFGSGPSTGTFEDTAAMAIYGRIERVVEADYLLSNAACQALAERIVKARSVRVDGIEVRVSVGAGRPFEIGDVEVGDLVTVDLWDPQLGQVLGAFRIVSRTVELASAGGEALSTTLALEAARFVDGRLVGSRTRHVPEVMARLTEVEARR